MPAVLDGRNEIILANWLADKHIICSINNDIPIEIPSQKITICLNLWLHTMTEDQN